MRETSSLLLEVYPSMKVTVSFCHGAISVKVSLFSKSEKKLG
jgi:hypothetical protein